MKLKYNTVYNHANNLVYVKTSGNLIYIICNQEDQQEQVVKRVVNDNCIFKSYEEVLTDDLDIEYVLVFEVIDDYELKQEFN